MLRIEENDVVEFTPSQEDWNEYDNYLESLADEQREMDAALEEDFEELEIEFNYAK